MITLQVIDRSAGSPIYSISRYGELKLEDTVKVQRWDGGLLLVESERTHKFDKDGCYIETWRNK